MGIMVYSSFWAMQHFDHQPLRWHFGLIRYSVYIFASSCSSCPAKMSGGRRLVAALSRKRRIERLEPKFVRHGPSPPYDTSILLQRSRLSCEIEVLRRAKANNNPTVRAPTFYRWSALTQTQEAGAEARWLCGCVTAPGHRLLPTLHASSVSAELPGFKRATTSA